MQFVDQRLAHRLELTDAHSGVAFARAHASRFPESGATAESFAGEARIGVAIHHVTAEIAFHGKILRGAGRQSGDRRS